MADPIDNILGFDMGAIRILFPEFVGEHLTPFHLLPFP
jgi:hypothetical protein